MSHSGYLDKESKNILFNYQLLIEQQPVVGVAGVGMAQPGDTSVSPAVLDALFQSDFWFWFKIVDPTGWSSWPDLFAAGQRVHDVPSSDTWNKVMAWLTFGLAALCAMPMTGVLKGIKAGAIKLLSLIPKNPKMIFSGIEKLMNEILQSSEARNTLSSWLNEGLKTFANNATVVQILNKFKTALQTGKFSIDEFIGLSAQQRQVVERVLENSTLVLKGERAIVIPKAGTKELEQFWATTFEKYKAGELPKSTALEKAIATIGKTIKTGKEASIQGGTLATQAGARYYNQIPAGTAPGAVANLVTGYKPQTLDQRGKEIDSIISGLK